MHLSLIFSQRFGLLRFRRGQNGTRSDTGTPPGRKAPSAPKASPGDTYAGIVE